MYHPYIHISMPIYLQISTQIYKCMYIYIDFMYTYIYQSISFVNFLSLYMIYGIRTINNQYPVILEIYIK